MTEHRRGTVKPKRRMPIPRMVDALIWESGKVDYQIVSDRNVIQTTKYLLQKYLYKARKP